MSRELLPNALEEWRRGRGLEVHDRGLGAARGIMNGLWITLIGVLLVAGAIWEPSLMLAGAGLGMTTLAVMKHRARLTPEQREAEADQLLFEADPDFALELGLPIAVAAAEGEQARLEMQKKERELREREMEHRKFLQQAHIERFGKHAATFSVWPP